MLILLVAGGRVLTCGTFIRIYLCALFLFLIEIIIYFTLIEFILLLLMRTPVLRSMKLCTFLMKRFIFKMSNSFCRITHQILWMFICEWILCNAVINLRVFMNFRFVSRLLILPRMFCFQFSFNCGLMRAAHIWLTEFNIIYMNIYPHAGRVFAAHIYVALFFIFIKRRSYRCNFCFC